MLSFILVLELANIFILENIYYIIKCSSRSVSVAKNSRKAFSKPFFPSEKEKSDEKKISSSFRISTVSRVTISKLFYKVVSL